MCHWVMPTVKSENTHLLARTAELVKTFIAHETVHFLGGPGRPVWPHPLRDAPATARSELDKAPLSRELMRRHNWQDQTISVC